MVSLRCPIGGGGWGQSVPEWTVASSDPLFIGMQNNGQWSVTWGVVGTDLVAEVIMVTTVCFAERGRRKNPSSGIHLVRANSFFDSSWQLNAPFNATLRPFFFPPLLITHPSLLTFYCCPYSKSTSQNKHRCKTHMSNVVCVN